MGVAEAGRELRRRQAADSARADKHDRVAARQRGFDIGAEVIERHEPRARNVPGRELVRIADVDELGAVRQELRDLGGGERFDHASVITADVMVCKGSVLADAITTRNHVRLSRCASAGVEYATVVERYRVVLRPLAIVIASAALLSRAVAAAPAVVDPTPVEVIGITDAVQLASSAYADRTCARRANGHVVCWGGRFTGNTGVVDPKPVEVPGLSDAVDVAVSVHNACARKRDGSVVCWGAKDANERVVWTTPTPVPALARTTVLYGDAMTCGAGPNVLACTDGSDSVFHPVPGAPRRVWRGDKGRWEWRCFEVASAITCEVSYAERHAGTSLALETDFGDLDGIRDLALPSDSIDTTCVVRRGGSVECRANEDAPGSYVAISALADVVALRHGCALRANGTVACWDEGGRQRDAVKAVAGITDAVELVAGDVHYCVRRKTGHVACWGYIGLLGDGRRPTP